MDKNEKEQTAISNSLVANFTTNEQDKKDMAVNPEKVIKKYVETAVTQVQQGRALEQDKVIYRLVVSTLGIVLVAVVLGIIFKVDFTSDKDHVPAVLTALSSACVGALAGILAPSPVSNK